MKPDSSAWLEKDENYLAEHLGWLAGGEYRRELAWVLPRLDEVQAKTVLEFGSASGLLAHALIESRPSLSYLGVEKCGEFLALAQSKLLYPESRPLEFRRGDVRDPLGGLYDTVLAFSFFKHFELSEWDQIVLKVLRLGRSAAFDMQLLHKDLDNGHDFPHVFVREERLLEVVRRAGHELVARTQWIESPLEGEGTMRDVAFWTLKKG